ncbi:MAG: hypothetical protein FGM23_00225 [Alphaproteobacteria bacterium]|nr:hypothetical protein [Alphaproteobacteria bacterium]
MMLRTMMMQQMDAMLANWRVPNHGTMLIQMISLVKLKAPSTKIPLSLGLKLALPKTISCGRVATWLVGQPP